MKLYAVRDRLLDYYQQPFTGPNDHQVMASLAHLVNNEETNNAIAKAPQHFELWKLAEIEEQTGVVTPAAELVCDCTSLIRSGIRRGTTAGNPAVDQVTGGQPRPTGAINGHAGPQGGPPESEAPTAPR